LKARRNLQARPGEHGMARLLVSLALLLLGLAAWPRLPLAFEPSTLFPELGISLKIPGNAESESDRSRWLADLQSALRSSGQVSTTSGDVGAGSIDLRVRYQPGVDIEAKATLLESLLGQLRRGLPAGAYLRVYPRYQRGGSFAFVAEVERADPALLEAVRQLPGVAKASYSGTRSPELRFELPPSDALHPLPLDASQVAAALQPRRLGSWPTARGELAVEVAPELLEQVRAERSIFGQFGHFRALDGEPTLAARVDGRAAELLVVDRDPEASPLAVGQALRRELEGAGESGGRFLRDEAQPLRQMLARLGSALLAAGVLLSLLHLLFFSARQALWQLLALPLGLAAALPWLYLAGESLDVLSLPALFLAVLLAPLPVALGKRGSPAWGRLLLALTAAATLPVALALVGRLGIFLGPAARVFLLAFAAAAIAQLLLPATGPPRPRVARVARRVQELARRRSGSLLLATAACLYLSWILFSSVLWPRAGSLGQNLGDLAITLQLPVEASFATTTEQVVQAEEVLSRVDGVAGFFSLYSRGQARIFADMEARTSSRAELERAARHIERNLYSLGVVARARPLGAADNAPPLRFDENASEFEAHNNPRSRTYRVLLRSHDFSTLLAAELKIRLKLRGQTGISKIELIPEWRAPEPSLELRALPGTSRQEIAGAAGAMARVFVQGSAAALPRLPGQNAPLLLRLVPAGSLEKDVLDEPTLEQTLAALRSEDEDFARHFTLEETFTQPELHFESGLYVLPIDFEISTGGSFWALERDNVRASLERMPLPPGAQIELPSLEGEPFDKKLRKIASLSLLPLLLLALLAIRLDSLPLAAAALLPGLGALAASAPLLRSHAGGTDEATLLALAAILTGLLPLAAFAAQVCRRPRPSSGEALEAPQSLWATRGHRELSRVLPKIAPALLAASLVLLFAAVDLEAERHPWVKPQRAAGLALLAGAALALFVTPALQIATESTLRRLRRDERLRRRAKAHPSLWREPGENVLEVRSLSKRYGNGFRALRRVDLRLEPGIIALLGPNGAGKTTLLRTLCGTLTPSRGQVLFRGIPVLPENLQAFRHRVGYLPQSFNAWDGLSAERFLDYWADVLSLPEGEARRREIEGALESVGLEAKAKSAVRELSGGQRRRLGIARALLGQPPILIVDEPTTGLDVEARNQLRQSLVNLAGERIVIFSTHIASDVAAVSKRVLILDRGRLLFDGPPGELIEEASGKVFERLLSEDELRPFSRRFHITTRIRESEGIRVRAVVHPGQEPEGKVVPANLEEAYLARLGSAAKVRDERSWASLLDLDAWRSR